MGIVVTIEREHVGELRYLNAGTNGKPEVVRLPIARGTLACKETPQIADELDAIIVCSDLQGVVPARQRSDRATIEAGAVPFTVCGHCHWPEPLASHEAGQILNVDERCVLSVAR